MTAALETPMLSKMEDGGAAVEKMIAKEANRGETVQKADAQNVSAISSCAVYLSCSTIMVLTNKWLAAGLDVNAHVRLSRMRNLQLRR